MGYGVVYIYAGTGKMRPSPLVAGVGPPPGVHVRFTRDDRTHLEVGSWKLGRIAAHENFKNLRNCRGRRTFAYFGRKQGPVTQLYESDSSRSENGTRYSAILIRLAMETCSNSQS
jgi:hypothetical protein